MQTRERRTPRTTKNPPRLVFCWRVQCISQASGTVLDGRGHAVDLGAGDARIARCLGGVHLAGADHLTIGRLEVEVGLAVGGRLALIPVIVAAVRLHRCNTVLRRRFGLVKLAVEDGLGIVCLENKTELTIATLAKFKPTSHWDAPHVRQRMRTLRGEKAVNARHHCSRKAAKARRCSGVFLYRGRRVPPRLQARLQAEGADDGAALSLGAASPSAAGGASLDARKSS